MAKVAVTGGAGFLGSHIADALSNKGHEVCIIDVKKSDYLRDDQTIKIGDICDADFMNKALDGIEYVYHLAALADLNEAKNKPIETVEVNIKGTVILLEAARMHNVKRVVFGSSVYVYSKQGGFYRCSKQACEAYLEEYQRKYDLNYTVLRYGSLYGPRADESNGVYRLLNQFMNNSTYEHSGQATDKREYIHVQDAAQLSATILTEHYENKHYVLTGNDKLETAELFKMFEEILGKRVDVSYQNTGNVKSGHYAITPYTYIPSIGKKLVTNEFVDMGQGIIQLLEEMQRKQNSND